METAQLGEDAPRALALWGLRDARLTRASWGLNNRSWFVDAPDGQFVLRLYTSASQGEVSSEHAFLRKLQSRQLPFATPRPVAALDGSTNPLIPGTRTVAALFGRIAGEHPDDEDVAAVEAAGAAFAQLDATLATLSTSRDPWNGTVSSVHPQVGDLSSLDEIGPQGADFVRRMDGAPSQLRHTIAPRQVIHGDFGFGNVLIQDGSVVGILDLEFLAEDARAAELATALRLVLSKGSRDHIWRPLLRGYLSRLPLREHEIEALPILALQHQAVVLVWGLGMHRSGRFDGQWLAQRVERALALETWMSGHANELTRYARDVAGSVPAAGFEPALDSS